MNLNKSINIGSSILDQSKVLMQHIHYNYIQNRDGDKT